MELLQKSILVAGMLLTGTVNTLTKKVQNDCTAVGITGKEHDFDHAWFQTAVMFAGEAICLFVFFFLRCMERQKLQNNPSINHEMSKPISSPWKNIFIFIIPTCCDVLGTSFGGLGLIWVPASVWQMMRGSIIIFSGILSVLFLKRKFYFYRWLGIGVVTLGLAVVGVSSMMSGSDDNTNTSPHQLILGLVLIIIGQFFNALQMVLEETFIKKRNFAPLQIVGMEGIWGVFLMCAIILPIMQIIPGSSEGSYENSLDAIAMIKNNHLLLAMIICYWISIAFYNFCGLAVTKKLTAVHRTLVDALRTILVWGVDLFIYYLIDESFGESWNHYSYVQVLGFMLLLLGTTIYNAVLKIPGLYYEPTMVNAVLQEEKKPLLLSEDEEKK